MANSSEARWIEIKLQVLPFYLEQLSAFIFATGAQGIKEEENGFKIYYDGKNWSPETYYLLLKELQRVVPDFDASRMAVQVKKNEDWLQNWKKNFKPFHLTKKLVIQPHWENYRKQPGETVVTIAPKMAFGTGHHESTQLCLLLIDFFLKFGMRVLDVGSGSGILSVYTRKMGAAKVLGIDNDPISIENAYENLALNGIQDGVEFKLADAHDFKGSHFDLVMANINRNILIEIAETLTNATRKGGILILSGILITDRQKILDAFEPIGFDLAKEVTKNEWIGLALKKKAGKNA